MEIQSHPQPPVTLSDFQRFLTIQKGFTTEEALSICHDIKRHLEYVSLFAEFEESTMEEA